MMLDEMKEKYNRLLENISNNLDISPSKYKQALDRFDSVSRWFQNSQNQPLLFKLRIYMQGSFRLGTVVRPLKNQEESDYDIDLVCEVQSIKNSTTAYGLKMAIKDRLDESETYSKLLDDEGKRCWTLNYAEQDGIGFHMDILPATFEAESKKEIIRSLGVPNEIANLAIAITNKKNSEYNWLSSNPDGYAEWFSSVNRKAFEILAPVQRKTLLKENNLIFNSDSDIPNALIKTPLQRAIQILKRHRDQRFAESEFESDKPISIIITTLSALSYNGEMDTYSALKSIIDNLRFYSGLMSRSLNEEHYLDKKLIQKNPNGIWTILNPVNPDENFADRWHENDDRKAKAFFQWITWVAEDLLDILNQSNNMQRLTESLNASLGKQVVQKAINMDSNFILPSIPPKRVYTIENVSKPYKKC